MGAQGMNEDQKYDELRKIFARYMDLILEREGVDYFEMDYDRFNKKELDLLRQIRQEANALPRWVHGMKPSE